MTKIKEQAVKMIQSIPDDKVIYIIDILKGLQGLYLNEEKRESSNAAGNTAKGIFKKYANPDLIEQEKSAWGEAVREKHGNH